MDSSKIKNIIDKSLTETNKRVSDIYDKVDVLLENIDNIIPEVPDEGKKAGEAIEKEILGDESKKDETLKEHEDNIIPEVPDEGNRAAALIKKALSDDNPEISTDIKSEIDTKDSSTINDVNSGIDPDSLSKTVNLINKSLSENSEKKIR